jgi:DNA-directed RNA polymerase subunit E'/Rpb7
MIDDKEIKITSCYYIIKDLELNTFIENDKLNSNIIFNIIKNLKNKYCGKCLNDIGFIDDIISIDNESTEENYVSFSELNAFVHFTNIKSNILVYKPIINDIIIVVINKLFPKINCENGPLKIVVLYNNIDQNNFSFINQDIIHKKSGKKLSIGSYVLVKLTKITIKQNLPFIYADCVVLDIVDDDNKINKFFKEKQIIIN